jgi:soluble lytic murein transglycosylase-like protein
MDSLTSVRISIVKKWADKYSLNVALVCAVVEQETGGTWDAYTTRNEDDFFTRYVAGKEMPGDSIRSKSTEARTRAMSFGLMQVIGETAREHGFSDRYLTKLCSYDSGLDLGCRVLRAMIDRAGGNIPAGLQFYNGGSNPDYASQVMARMKNYEEQ